MKTFLIVNGNRSNKPLSPITLNRLRAAVDEAGPGGRMEVSESLDEARRFVDEAVDGGFEALWMGGGDGTVNVLLNHAFGRGLALGVVPMGTVNALARSLGLPLNPVAAAQRLARAQPVVVDAAQVAGRKFLCFASIGFDAAVVHEVTGDFKRQWGRAAYLAAGLRALALPDRLAPFRVEFDCGMAAGAERETTVEQAAQAAFHALAGEANADSGDDTDPGSDGATEAKEAGTGTLGVGGHGGGALLDEGRPVSQAVATASTLDLLRGRQDVPVMEEGYSLVVSKISNYAGFSLFPSVEPCSGQMETWLFRRNRPDDLVAWTAQAAVGPVLGGPLRQWLQSSVGHYMTGAFTVRSESPLFLQVDGEAVTPENARELRFECLPNGATVLRG